MGELMTGINWLAVGIGTVLSFCLGAMWFSPVMFGQKWAAGVGVKAGEGATQPFALLLQFVGTLLLAWLVGIAAANEALLLAALLALTVSLLLGASDLLAGSSRYAAVVEGAFPIVMVVIMVLCHIVLP
ncbi:MAG: DUF1761 family protein [Pseudohongiellaceae bacterium]